MPGNRDRDDQLWHKLVAEGLVYDGPTNTSLPFGKMSQRYGKAWICYLRAAYEAKGELSDEEFGHLNGGVPPHFIERTLREHISE